MLPFPRVCCVCSLTSRERKKAKRMVCECQFDPGIYTHITWSSVCMCI